MNICSNHKRTYELICCDCNVLMCSACTPQHRLHLFYHIDGIKSEINSSNNNNNNSNNSSNIPSLLDIQSNIKTTFDSLRSAVKEYQQLQQTEDEISNRFKDLHEFLVLEEHKLKKPIIDNKEHLEQQIKSQTTIMKSLNLMNHQLNNLISDDTDNIQQDQSTKTTTSSLSADTTDCYQISTIMTSISQSSSHNEFIQNNNTLFNLNDNRYSINKIDDHSLLNVILEHNNTLKSNNHNNIKHNQPQQYQLITNDQQLNQIKSQLQSTFKLVSQQQQQQQPKKQSYILSTDTTGKISVIDITDHNNIHFTQQDIPTFNSTLYYYCCTIVGNHFYKFGSTGMGRVLKYFRYSIDNQTFDEIKMKGIEGCCAVSVCYDGKDHIYLMDGFNKPILHIYRFNINSSTFEEYSTANISSQYYHHLTFHFNNCIYSFIPDAKKIVKFDIKTKKTVEFDLPIESQYLQQRAACTDGKGYLFFLSDTRFQQINIETNEITNLDRSTAVIANMKMNCHNLIYHQSNDQKRYIYSLQGKDKNFRYSFEHNKWESILQNDQSNRIHCANTLFHI
ncbi:hypothetical protein PPL_08296 [Heterostelium album PN500]|uniref:B box-type domain-containing protein n=1 Tax=Heterostelium pallidum (strain ATCC 26659 / Pp 5 / PN500) TaxID=670386 RepID=D3BHT2_HETP5|nr:hypothetical protein PPL_08296 [Heterostelium album PN500]EFA78832.1 hypothetical protein PPL_08296 [Heterostelium album PN500]|eukprot:XP_020430956.1 hypothetical protein PPL_08296 [Heterostelium album PN500]